MHKLSLKLCFLNRSRIIYGDDSLVQYWYAIILTNFSSAGGEAQCSNCLIEHLVEFYRSKLDTVPSKSKYIRKMLYMLNSLRNPLDIEALK